MNRFPRMAFVEQEFPRPQVENVEEAVRQELDRRLFSKQSLRGKHIAVAVGSRGITAIDRITRTALDLLKAQGAEPFLIPAMGSHGGGTEEGQLHILADYGITPQAMGAPIHSALETVPLGETAEGYPVYMARTAYEADGTILINRIKPHTDFHGAVESGLLKMIAIGLGKIEGALTFHSTTFDHPHSEMILSIGRAALNTGKILGGISLLENACHETAAVEFVLPQNMEAREKELLPQAKTLMPSLPVENADMLIVDYIGKNISGVGLDPNITGRSYRINARWQDSPNITRIIVLDITDQTDGNAVGIGLADFCSQRVLERMDRRKTNLNALVSRNVICANIPPYYDTEREMMEQAMISLREGTNAANARILRIENTLELSRIQASEALLPELEKHPNVRNIGPLEKMRFDAAGALERVFEGVMRGDVDSVWNL